MYIQQKTFFEFQCVSMKESHRTQGKYLDTFKKNISKCPIKVWKDAPLHPSPGQISLLTPGVGKVKRLNLPTGGKQVTHLRTDALLTVTCVAIWNPVQHLLSVY